MKVFRILALSVFLLLIFVPIDSIGACRRIATVKYQQQYGWSKKYTVEVTFLTGLELNQATGTYNYRSSSVYAVIFWDQGEATVIRLSSVLLCGYEVDCECIDNTIMDLQGYDQDDDKWNICLSDFCF